MERSERIQDILGVLALRIKRIRDVIGSINEEETKYYLVNPLLRVLGWDVEDFEQTRLEVPVKIGNNRADFVLHYKGEPVLIVEAKSLGTPLNDIVIGDVSRYPHNLDIRWCFLTDGNEYVLLDGTAKTNNRIVERFLITDMKQEGYELLNLIEPHNVSFGVLEERRLTPKISKYYLDWKINNHFKGDPRQYIRKKLAQENLCEETSQSILSTIQDILLKLDGEKNHNSLTDETTEDVVKETQELISDETIEDDKEFLTGIPDNILVLYKTIDQFCLSIKEGMIKRHVRAKYISYICEKNKGFCDMRWQKGFLKIWLHLKYNPSYPTNIRDVSKIGHWGNGDIEVNFSSLDQLDTINKLILESYELKMQQ